MEKACGAPPGGLLVLGAVKAWKVGAQRNDGTTEEDLQCLAPPEPRIGPGGEKWRTRRGRRPARASNQTTIGAETLALCWESGPGVNTTPRFLQDGVLIEQQKLLKVVHDQRNGSFCASCSNSGALPLHREEFSHIHCRSGPKLCVPLPVACLPPGGWHLRCQAHLQRGPRRLLHPWCHFRLPGRGPCSAARQSRLHRSAVARPDKKRGHGPHGRSWSTIGAQFLP